MNILIIGYGRVGSRTAELVESVGHEVVVVEEIATKAEAARTAGFEVVEGDAEDTRILEAAGIADADALAALTGDLNVNYIVCLVGKEHGCRTVLRIDEDYREDIYQTYASDVDDVVYPERLGAAGAKMALLGGEFDVLADLTESLTLATVRISGDSPAVGRRVVELDLPGEARLYAHGHAAEPMTLPLPRTEIEPGDRVAIIAEQSSLSGVRAALHG